MIDINVDESATSIEKITINSRSLNNLYSDSKRHINYNDYSIIKCYKNLPSIITLEAKSINIIKIHKTIFFNLSNLINVDLHNNKLLKISKNFKLFKNLKSLKLDSNQISFIPSFIGDFTNLEVFSISSNLITYIPTSIKNLINLKLLNFSNNKVERLPIELGQLESLQVLYMDINYFTSIPTTLCYLKRLNELCFDWLEFVDPPYYRLIKDSVGKTIICIIIKCLDAMLKQSLLYCDFKTFVEKISPKKPWEENGGEKEDEKTLKMSKSELNEEKNNKCFIYKPDEETPIASYKNDNDINNINNMNNKYHKIFQAIENNYIGVIKSLLESEDCEKYLNVKNAENKKPFYLAINSKNDEIIDIFFEKIKEKKIKLNYLYLYKAIRTRDPPLVKKLVQYGVSPENVDDQGKGVFHILFGCFTKQISKCILIGDFLLEQGVPLNKKDMDNWAPIHIATSKACKQCLLWIISSNEILRKKGRETFDLNLKGKNGWTPLHLTISSFRIEETLILLKQGCDIFARNYDANTPKKVCSSNFVFSKLLSHCENVRLREKYETKEKYDYIENYLKNVKSERLFESEKNNIFIKDEKKENINNILKRGITYNKFLDINLDTSDFFQDLPSTSKHYEKSKIKNKKTEKIGSELNVNFKMPLEQKAISDISSSVNNEEPINITAQKERILNREWHLNEKYEAFMFIKLNKSCNSEIIRSLLENLDLQHLHNINLVSDICNYIISNFMTSLIPCLKSLLANKLLKNINFIKIELKNTINILEKVSNKVIIPVNKQKTKVSSKSIMNHKYGDDDDDNDEKFIQDSDIMNDDLVEEDNELNFDMKNLYMNKEEDIKNLE